MLATISILATGLTACAGKDAPSDSPSDQAGSQTQSEMSTAESPPQSGNELERRLEARRGGNKPMPDPVPQDTTEQVIGEVPEGILQAIKEDLTKRANIGAGDADVIKAEAVTWNDGSLGCPKPGEMYTHALVPGYRVVLQHAGTQYDYRATERGYFFLCEMPGPLRPPFDKQ